MRQTALLHLGQSFGQRHRDLIGAAGRTGAAVHTLHPLDRILCLHILQQAADALQVAVAAAQNFHIGDGVIFTQLHAGHLGAGAFICIRMNHSILHDPFFSAVIY